MRKCSPRHTAHRVSDSNSFRCTGIVLQHAESRLEGMQGTHRLSQKGHIQPPVVPDQIPSLAIGGRTTFTYLQESISYESHLVARALTSSSCPVAPFCATSFPDMQRFWAYTLLDKFTARCNELCMEV